MQSCDQQDKNEKENKKDVENVYAEIKGQLECIQRSKRISMRRKLKFANTNIIYRWSDYLMTKEKYSSRTNFIKQNSGTVRPL